MIGIHPDLEWIAASPWPSFAKSASLDGSGTRRYYDNPSVGDYSHPQYLHARHLLGLDDDTKEESNMHPDLEWLARNVSEWPGTKYVSLYKGSMICAREPFPGAVSFMYPQWLQARQDLGLVMSESEEQDYAPERPSSVPAGVESRDEKYSAYFRDVRHIDAIDVYRAVDLFGCEKHGHPISHAAKKLLLSGIRTGGKDVEEDVREAIDTLNRWLEMREEDKNAL